MWIEEKIKWMNQMKKQKTKSITVNRRFVLIKERKKTFSSFAFTLRNFSIDTKIYEWVDGNRLNLLIKAI